MAQQTQTSQRKPDRIQPGYERNATCINVAVPHEFKDRLWQRAKANGMGLSEFIWHILVENDPNLKQLSRASSS
jgi:hypothetical protein